MKSDSITPFPKLAVIITCWNYEEYVASAIRSIVLQNCADVELVVIDDGSTDSSWSIIHSESVRAYSIENRGQLGACLYGLDRTKAPFVLFLDADDELAPGALKRIVSEIDGDVAKLQFSMTRINRDGAELQPYTQLQTFRSRSKLADRVLKTGQYTTPPTSGNVFRRDLCELLREVDYDRATDGVILFAAPFFGDVVSLSEPLGRYRIHDRNDSGIGRPVDPLSLKRDLRRFTDRLNHLRRVLVRFKKADKLVDAEQTSFVLEHRLYLAIAEGRRPSLRLFSKMVMQLWREYHSLKTKLVFTAFYTVLVMASNDRARRALAYRLGVEKRSMAGLFQALCKGA